MGKSEFHKRAWHQRSLALPLPLQGQRGEAGRKRHNPSRRKYSLYDDATMTWEQHRNENAQFPQRADRTRLPKLLGQTTDAVMLRQTCYRRNSLEYLRV